MTGHEESEPVTIRAAVLRKRGGPLRIETLEMDGPLEDEVLVRIVASGVCHTDIDLCDGWDGGTPVVLGHEGAGVVERVGGNITLVKPGDRVALSYQSCGACDQCLGGRPAHCRRFFELNFEFTRAHGDNALQRSGVQGHFFGQSSFATHTLATERNLVKVDQTTPPEILAPLGCGLQTGAGTILNSLDVPTGASVAVLGTGAVGLAAVMAARIAGADPIIAVDIVPARLELALELGATHAIDNRREDVASRIVAITGHGVDYTLETTGNSGVESLAIDVLNPQGTAAFIAAPSGSRSLSKGRRILGIIAGDAVPQVFIPRMIKLYKEGRFPFDRTLRFYDFGDVNQAMADSKSGLAIKPVLRISEP